jgi:hypothetical protein
MKTKTWKIFTALFVSAVAALTVIACGYWPEEWDSRELSLFAPEVIHEPAAEPFFVSDHMYYMPKNDMYGMPETTPTLTDRNTAEWVTFFEGKLSEEDVSWLVYESNEVTVKILGGVYEKLTVTASDSVPPAVVKYFKNYKLGKEVAEYLAYALSVEHVYLDSYSSWDGPVAIDTTGIKLNWLKEQFAKTNNPFLKSRYGFQITRALSRLSNFEECIRFYDTEFKPTPAAGSMYYRSMGYKARSLYYLKRYSEANYLYAQLFNNDPCSRYQAYQSFHPQEEKDWQGTLALAKTAEEKEMLWQLLGIYADPVRAISAIYALNPQSKHLPLLLVRAINQAEAIALHNPKRYEDYYSEFYMEPLIPQGGKNTWEDDYQNEYSKKLSLVDLDKTLEHISSDKKTNNPALWDLAAGYLKILTGKYEPSKRLINQALPAANDTLMLGQQAILKSILAVKELRSIDARVETEMYAHIQAINALKHPALRSESAARYILTTMAVLYKKQGDLMKSELAYPRGLEYYTNTTATQKIIDFMHDKNLNPMEKHLAQNYSLTIGMLHGIKSVQYTYTDNMEAALKEYEQYEAGNYNTLYCNPLVVEINDCYNCGLTADEDHWKYGRWSFLKEMIELKHIADSSKNNKIRAKSYFEYANGLYNITGFGCAKHMFDSPVTYASNVGDLYDETLPYIKLGYTNCRYALEYYNKAEELSTDKEFKAKCAWMAAKCERNIWLEKGYLASAENYDYNWPGDFVAGKYFALMKEKYANTKYYQEVINECGYFCTYITHSKDCIKNKDNY